MSRPSAKSSPKVLSSLEIQRGIRKEIAESAADPAYRDVAIYEAVKNAFAEGGGFGEALYEEFLGSPENWRVDKPVEFASHRKFIGPVLIALKNWFLYPLNRWLYTYTWENFHRQAKLNRRMLAVMESLAAENMRLKMRMSVLEAEAFGRNFLVGDGEGLQTALPMEPTPDSDPDLPRMRIAFVVHRYGRDVGGGSEMHCLEFAERLAEEHDVTVLTTCAKDYITWSNGFPEGHGMEGPVKTIRFPVARPRSPQRFHEISRHAFTGRASKEIEHEWFEENGPYSPELIEYVQRHADAFDFFIFFTYRYYQTFFGLPPVKDKALLVPTAEEDPAIRLQVLKEFFTLPRAIAHNTPEEREMIAQRLDGPLPPNRIVGAGVPEQGQAASVFELERLGVPERFLLYLGRVDPNKGCRTLLEYYERYAGAVQEPVPLVLAGKVAMPVPDSPYILPLGYVSDEVREALLARCTVFFAPSPFESLCMAVLEAWNHGRPVLVNGECKVLKAHVLRSNGGLCYESALEFEGSLSWLLEHPEEAAELGRMGEAYVREHYTWERVMRRLKMLIAENFVEAPATVEK